MILILLGPPGVGKGTQAAALAGATDSLTHLSTGEMLRDEVARGTELGMNAKAIIDRGDLVPDDIMVAMVAGRIDSRDPGETLMLDGFPRTLPQAQALAEKAPGGAIRLAVYFAAPDSVLTDRLLNRGRVDDTREIIEHRLALYRQTTEPLIAFYRDQGLLREIQADRPISSIQEEFADVVRSAFQNL